MIEQDSTILTGEFLYKLFYCLKSEFFSVNYMPDWIQKNMGLTISLDQVKSKLNAYKKNINQENSTYSGDGDKIIDDVFICLNQCGMNCSQIVTYLIVQYNLFVRSEYVEGRMLSLKHRGVQLRRVAHLTLLRSKFTTTEFIELMAEHQNDPKAILSYLKEKGLVPPVNIGHVVRRINAINSGAEQPPPPLCFESGRLVVSKSPQMDTPLSQQDAKLTSLLQQINRLEAEIQELKKAVSLALNQEKGVDSR